MNIRTEDLKSEFKPFKIQIEFSSQEDVQLFLRYFNKPKDLSHSCLNGIIDKLEDRNVF